jgi:hypothetical protein
MQRPARIADAGSLEEREDTEEFRHALRESAFGDAIDSPDDRRRAFEGENVDRARASEQGFGPNQPHGCGFPAVDAHDPGENIVQVDDPPAHFLSHSLGARHPTRNLRAIRTQQPRGRIRTKGIHNAVK